MLPGERSNCCLNLTVGKFLGLTGAWAVCESIHPGFFEPSYPIGDSSR